MSDVPSAPEFSVVVPTLNRPAQLTGLLEALSDQRFPGHCFEVVLVNDGGTDPEPVVAPFRSALRIVLLHQQSRSGCAAARQRGVEVARGRYLAFTDDDCVPCPEWLARMEAASRRDPGAACGGIVLNGRPGSALAEASQMVVNYFTDRENQLLSGPRGTNGRPPCDDAGMADDDAPCEPRYFPTNNLMFPADAFRAFSGLDTRWRIAGGEDRDLCHRWMAAGHRMAFVPNSVVHHCQALDLPGFLRQHFSYGRGALCHRRKNGLGGLFTQGGGLGFYARLPLLPFGRLPRRAAGRTAMLIAISQLCTLAGYGYEMISGSGRPAAKSERRVGSRPREVRARS